MVRIEEETGTLGMSTGRPFKNRNCLSLLALAMPVPEPQETQRAHTGSPPGNRDRRASGGGCWDASVYILLKHRGVYRGCTSHAL
jgi:hypothetical protein